MKILLIARALGVLLLVRSIWADCYLHNPRGSNNRLNEKSANRQNANRVFDSQNNNRGGYNVGDQSDQAFSTEDQQYNMKFFQSGSQGKSTLEIEWTNQHGCGGNEDSDPHKLNCNMVLQYMCQDQQNVKAGAFPLNYLRNGKRTNQQAYTPRSGNIDKVESYGQYQTRMKGNVEKEEVIHESWEWYDKCYVRRRNKYLFTADQKLRKNKWGYSSAQYTRQNPNGNRRGYECPEERDYYPYWHPTPWIDIAVLTDNTDDCKRYVSESYNSQRRNECFQNFTSGQWRHYSQYNENKTCVENGGEWGWKRSYLELYDNATTAQECSKMNASAGNVLMWDRVVSYESEVCFVPTPEVDCRSAPWSRVNHLGNGREGVPLNYTWHLPYFPSQKDKRCVFRIRYNITTDDYDPMNTTSEHNANIGLGRRSPVEQNPYVNIGGKTNHPLRLAINTAQFGRTFQDRSHVIILRSRKNYLSSQTNYDSVNIKNLNVRGKRGNIVQTFPSVEYDFIPNRLVICPDDLIHVQWTGSNRHNNGNPAGDGQAGDAGEGRGGTDRHNMVQTSESNINFPLPFERTTLWNDTAIYWKSFAGSSSVDSRDVSLAMSSSGYFHCYENCPSKKAKSRGKMLDRLLNNAPASFEGAILQFKKEDQLYHYMCTRNNNFTNRSQKGWIRVLAASAKQCPKPE